jgi:uroporphyrin-3 C-methyltransferase
VLKRSNLVSIHNELFTGPKMDNEHTDEVVESTPADPVDRLLQEKKPNSSGKAIAILALLVSFAAVSATGWQWWQTRQATPDENNQQQAVASLQNAQQQVAGSVAAFQAQLDALESPIDVAEFSRQGERLKSVEDRLGSVQGQSTQDQASISAVQGSVRSLEQRLTATEAGLINIAASSQNSSVELDIAEIDFLLRVANERLQLYSDPVAADLALQAADVQIEALDDPMFLSVRQRIASSRQALATVPRVDRVQLSAQLTEMQSQLRDLPFHGQAEVQAEPVLADDAGWWASFKHTLASLVTVRRRVPEDQSMLSLDDKDYLRQGLWLQLESARLALMRNDTIAYNGSLDRVSITVEKFFQGSSPAVQALLHATADLKSVDISPQMPDISAPWTQLRQLRDSRRLLQSATPLESGDSVE